MLVTFTGRDPKQVSNETWPGLRHLRWDDPDHRPAVWAFSPVSRGNPYQAVLYGSMLRHNILATPGYDIGTAAGMLTSLPAEMDRVLHLHWLNVVMSKAGTIPTGRRLMDEFLVKISRLRDSGIKIVWTLHNVLPHDTLIEELEVELREQVIASADLVHVMSTRSAELVAPWFALPPDRTYQSPLPGYQGVYPRWIAPADARRELGLPPDALVWMLMGAIKPYKGLTELMHAVDVVSRERPGEVALVVAGVPDRNAETLAFLDRARVHPAVYVYPRKIPNDDVQLLFHAADVAMVPYRRSLNSSALTLALTFGVPVVVPSASGGTPLVDHDCAVVYDENDPNGLVDALRESARLATPEARAAAVAAGDRFERSRAADQFAGHMRTWLDGGVIPMYDTTVPPDVLEQVRQRDTAERAAELAEKAQVARMTPADPTQVPA